jgi:uncharacterized protein (TIGR00369 family)
MGKILDNLQGIIRVGGQVAPIAKLLDFRLTHVEPGSATVELDVTERFWNPMGSLHGGILCDIADAAMGLAYAAGLNDDESFTTIELKINYLRPFKEGHLKAVAKTVHRGRTVGVLDCEVFDDRGKIIARSSSTCLTLRGEQTKGRTF